MSASIIDGKAISESVKQRIAERVSERVAQGLRAPGLAVILVGDDAASQVYVKNKTNACDKVGFKSEAVILPTDSKQEELEAIIDTFNEDDSIDGILLQLPLPAHLKRPSLPRRVYIKSLIGVARGF